MNDVVAPVWNGIDFKAEAHRDPWSMPLDEIDVSNPYLYPKTPGTASLPGCGATIQCTSVTALSTVLLVGDPLPGHHDRRHVAPDVLFGRRVRGHHAERRPPRLWSCWVGHF